MEGAGLTAVVRALRPADIQPVSEIFAWYVQHTVVTFEESPRRGQEWAELSVLLEELGLPFLVAEVDGTVAGYAYASPWRRKPAYRHTVEDSVFVAAGLTGRGIGRELLGGLLAACSAAGARQMIAVIADTGDRASAGLHTALGFTEAGRLKAVGYKHGRWVDTVLMQRPVS